MLELFTWISILTAHCHCQYAESGSVCVEGEDIPLSKGLKMTCLEGKWEARQSESRAGGNPGKPCEDSTLVGQAQCQADREHCQQFTQAGAAMDKNCAGTCGTCDSCKCQDNHQWHQYCPYWAQYCHTPGALGSWMSSNCRKTCVKCGCPCCSYKGTSYRLGEKILLPDQCSMLVCEEGLKSPPSPLLPGATIFNISHPEELTLSFKIVHVGSDCCVLPGEGREGGGAVSQNGTLVPEGWTGIVKNSDGFVSATCCHGEWCVPLHGQDPCMKPYTVLDDSWRKIMYDGSNQTKLKCDRDVPAGWYRFMEPAGTKLPLVPPKSHGWYLETCGTAASAWVQNGTYPMVGDDVADIGICFAFTEVCQWSIVAKTVACSGGDGASFYLYYLQSAPKCWLAYCALGI